MSAFTTDPLSSLALISVQFTLMPFLIALWWHNRAYMGWTVSLAGVFIWQWPVRFGIGLGNVLPQYAADPTDAPQSQYMYNIILPMLAIISALCGTGFAYLIRLVYLLPLEFILPLGPGEAIDGDLTGKTKDASLMRQDVAIQSHSLSAYGFRYVPPPYLHFFVTFLGFVMGIVAPFTIFEQLFPINASAAFWTGAIVILIDFVLLALFWRFMSALAIFGVDEQNMKKRETDLNMMRKDDDSESRVTDDPDLSDEALRTAMYDRTHYRVWKTALVMGGIHLAFYIIICGVATYSNPANINVMWLLGFLFVAGFTLIIALVAIVYAVVQSSRRKHQAFAGSMSGDVATTSKSSSSGRKDAADEEDEEEGEEGEEDKKLIQARIRMTAVSPLSARKARGK